MQFFYDGQIRRYLLQTIRLLSNFVVKYGDGSLVRVPVMYGDADRQVAHINKQNSENKINSTPRIAVYISDLQMDRERLSDATHVGKVHIREREIDDADSTNPQYTSSQGKNYTVERLMPTPYKLTLKADIWSSSTEQKLQILEQIMMLFNPSLEIQTTDNYLDWTSLSVVNLTNMTFSNRQVPVGTESAIDIATLTFDMPIWISPPAKVKTLGVVTNIIMGIYKGSNPSTNGYIEGFGVDAVEAGPNLSDLMNTARASIDDFGVTIHGGSARILDPGENVTYANNNSLYVSVKNGLDINWRTMLDQYPGQFRSGVSRLFLIQEDGTEVSGTCVLNPLDEAVLTVNWDEDTYPTNTTIASTYRPNSPGTFDAIVDPEKSGPGSGLGASTVGTRYLIINNIGGGIRETLIAETRSNRIDTSIDFARVKDSRVLVNNVEVAFTPMNIQDKYVIRLASNAAVDDVITYELFVNEDGPDAWKNTDQSDFIANTNDIIEWDGTKWRVVFNAEATKDTIVYLTNIYTSVQYKWNGIQWRKSFEGEYMRGRWRLEL
jgi:hypothetical protein